MTTLFDRMFMLYMYVLGLVEVYTFWQSLGCIDTNSIKCDGGGGEVEHGRNILEGLLNF